MFKGKSHWESFISGLLWNKDEIEILCLPGYLPPFSESFQAKPCCSLMRFMKEIPRTMFTVTYLRILSIPQIPMLRGDFPAFHSLETQRWFLPQ